MENTLIATTIPFQTKNDGGHDLQYCVKSEISLWLYLVGFAADQESLWTVILVWAASNGRLDGTVALY